MVVWKERLCVEVREFGNDSEACLKACNEMNEPLERGIIPELTAQAWWAGSLESLALDVYPGYERDDKFRDQFDYSSDLANGDK